MELREVTLLNFDNTYQEQPQLSRVANEWIELQISPEPTSIVPDKHGKS